jgi:hypothetical protein
MLTKFWSENLIEGTTLVTLNERIILKRISRKQSVRMWVQLAHDKVQWQTIVNMVMNIRAP